MNIPKGWPTEEMIEAGKAERMECLAITTMDVGTALKKIFQAMLEAAPTSPEQVLPVAVLYALRFYANGEHFNIDNDCQEFDTVSGEPSNWLWSEKEDDCTCIEDGSIAKAVLQGKHIDGDENEPESAPIEGEIYSSAPPAQEGLKEALIADGTMQEDEPVAWANKGLGVISAKSRERMIEDGKYGGEFAIAAQTAERHDIPLYTRPSNDELRKAAERFSHTALLTAKFEDEEHREIFLASYGNLRAALEGGIMTHLNLQPNQLTAFEKWALSKGYDIELFNEPNAEGSLDYRDPVTMAAYEGWLEGVLVGMKVRERDK